MPNRRADLRVSYAIVSNPKSGWIPKHKSFQIEITYASGKVDTPQPLFVNPEISHTFIAHAYPDLAGTFGE